MNNQNLNIGHGLQNTLILDLNTNQWDPNGPVYPDGNQQINACTGQCNSAYLNTLKSNCFVLNLF